jgi:drug/metabolite transporter (DMT)-like permease
LIDSERLGFERISTTSRLRTYGVLAGLLSAIAYGAMSGIVHSYGVALPSTEIIFCRAVFALIVLVPFAWRDKGRLVSGSSVILWARSGFGAVSILCFTWNLQHTSIGLANVLFNIAPLAVISLAWVTGAKPLSTFQSICLLLVALGGGVFWSGEYGAVAPVLFVGIIGALAAGASYTALGRAAASWSPYTLTWAISLASIPVALGVKRGVWMAPSGPVLIPLASIAALCVFAQIMVALSYKWADLATATALASSSMAFGVFIDILLGSRSPIRQVLGCLIYLCGCIPLAVLSKKQANAQPTECSPSNHERLLENPRWIADIREEDIHGK